MGGGGDVSVKKCGFCVYFLIMYNCLLFSNYLQSSFMIFIGRQRWLEHSDEFNLSNREISKSPYGFSGVT